MDDAAPALARPRPSPRAVLMAWGLGPGVYALLAALVLLAALLMQMYRTGGERTDATEALLQMALAIAVVIPLVLAVRQLTHIAIATPERSAP